MSLDACVFCKGKVSDSDPSLDCGHRFHLSCVPCPVRECNSDESKRRDRLRQLLQRMVETYVKKDPGPAPRRPDSSTLHRICTGKSDAFPTRLSRK